MAEGFDLTQLLGDRFEVVAASPGITVQRRVGGPIWHDIIYLQGKVPGGSQEILIRCETSSDPERTDQCWQVN
jgi:hypothetical protein